MSWRKVGGVIGVSVGVALFGFGQWVAFGSAYLLRTPGPRVGAGANFIQGVSDQLQLVYTLLGGFALYAVGSYLLHGLRRTRPAPTQTVAKEVIAGLVKVRCLTCRQLNDEAAKYCNQCGHVV